MDSPKIPTLKDSQKPQVKVRGLEAGVTLFDRLKQFKKKDLAFILAGLGTLFMAPLAEHFMMAPETGSDLQAGMGGKGGGQGSGLFNGSGSSPYETTGGLAQGSPSGGGSDIITPLNVRDPSALVMGPGATQQPPTQSVAPSAPPPTAPVANKDSDLRDALAASARGIGGAAKAAKALLPVPKVALQGAGGLRGLGVVSGGSSAVGGPIASSNSLGKASTGGGGLNNVKALPGYRGTAGARGQGQGGSGIEALKAAGDKAGSAMNQGSAATALDNAASQGIPNGGSGIGGNGAGGTGSTDKPDSGNQDKSAKNVGESLDFLKQKAIQEAKIALWAKEQEANDMNLQMANMRNDALKTIVGAAATSIGTCVGNMVTGQTCVDPTKSPGSYKCASGATYPSMSMKSTCGDTSKGGAGYMATLDSTGVTYSIFNCAALNAGPVATSCTKFSADTASAKPTTNPADGPGVGNGPAGGATQMLADPSVVNLAGACTSIDGIAKDMDTGIANTTASGVSAAATKIKNYATAMKQRAQRTISWRDALTKGAGTNECGSKNLGVSAPLLKQQNDVLTSITSDANAGTTPGGLLPALAAALNMAPDDKGNAAAAPDPSKLPASTDIDKQITTASGDVKKLDDKDSDPTNQKISDKPTDADFKKVYTTMYQLPDAMLTSKVTATRGVFTQVDTAMTNVVKSVGTVRDIQKDLDGSVARLDAASGPSGTVALIVPQDAKASPVIAHAIYKRDGFTGEADLIKPIQLSSLGAGVPAKGLPDLITKAGKDLDTGITSDTNAWSKYIVVAKDSKNADMFPNTSGVLTTGFQSLINARNTQTGELGSLYTTLKADTTKLSSAQTAAASAQ